MRIVTVMGSPRKQHNTDRVLGWAEDTWRELGHEVERYDIVDYLVRGCQACHACQSATSPLPVCATDDDAGLVLGAIQASDLFVLASPVYCWGFTAQLKCLLDRSYCMTRETPEHTLHLLEGRRGALLTTSAGPVEDNADLLRRAFDALLRHHHCVNRGHLLVPGCGEPDDLSADVERQAAEFARQVAS